MPLRCACCNRFFQNSELQFKRTVKSWEINFPGVSLMYQGSYVKNECYQAAKKRYAKEHAIESPPISVADIPSTPSPGKIARKPYLSLSEKHRKKRFLEIINANSKRIFDSGVSMFVENQIGSLSSPFYRWELTFEFDTGKIFLYHRGDPVDHSFDLDEFECSFQELTKCFCCRGIGVSPSIIQKLTPKSLEVARKSSNILPIFDNNGLVFGEYLVGLKTAKTWRVFSLECTGKSDQCQCRQTAIRLRNQSAPGRTPMDIKIDELLTNAKKPKLEILLDSIFDHVKSHPDGSQNMTTQFESFLRSVLSNTLKKSKKARSWFTKKTNGPGMQLAMGLFVRGGKSFYKWISTYIVLPSISLLQKKAAAVPAKPGINPIPIECFLRKAISLKKFDFQIMTDEIILRSGIAYLKSEGGYELIGFCNLGNLTLTPGMKELVEYTTIEEEGDERSAQAPGSAQTPATTTRFQTTDSLNEWLTEKQEELV